MEKGNIGMKTLYVISGMTGMTGNELARQIIQRGDDIIGFDNFFAVETPGVHGDDL